MAVSHAATVTIGVYSKSLPVAPEKPADTLFAAALARLKHSAVRP
jgi:hypothetical protein